MTTRIFSFNEYQKDTHDCGVSYEFHYNLIWLCGVFSNVTTTTNIKQKVYEKPWADYISSASSATFCRRLGLMFTL